MYGLRLTFIVTVMCLGAGSIPVKTAGPCMITYSIELLMEKKLPTKSRPKISKKKPQMGKKKLSLNKSFSGKKNIW